MLLLSWLALGCQAWTSQPADQSVDWAIPVGLETPVTEFAPVGDHERDSTSVKLVEDLVLNEGTTGIVIFEPRSIVASPDGRMFVRDRGPNDVKVFRPDGSYLGAFGGEGQGPGEFMRLAQLALAGDVVVAYDSRKRRLSTWTQDGEYLGEYPLGARTVLDSMHGLDDGTLVARLTGFAADTGERTSRLVRITPRGEVLTEYYVTKSPRQAARLGGDPVANVQKSLEGLFVRLRTHYAVSTQGIVYVANLNAYQALALDAEGAQMWALKVPWPGMPWTDDAKDRLVGALGSGLPLGAVSAEDLTWPPRDRAMFAILADGAGRLYVFPEQGPLEPGTRLRPVDVYSPEGEFIAAGAVPNLWASSRGEFVYGLRLDAAGETEAVRYRLRIAEHSKE